MMLGKNKGEKIKVNLPNNEAEILSSISNPLYALDWDWCFTYVNEQAAFIFGGKPKDFVGQNIWERFPQIINTAHEVNYRKVMEERKPAQFAMRGILTDQWVGARVYPYTKGITVYWFDATEYKNIEGKLFLIRQRLNANINNSPLAVMEIDPLFRIISWSSEAENIFGWTSSEIVGRSISQMKWIYEGDDKLFRSKLASLISSITPTNFSVNRNYRKDRSVIWCEWYSSSVKNTEGKIVSILCQVLDITELVKAEETLREQRDQIERQARFFDFILSNIADSVWAWNRERRIVYANKVTADRWGLTRSQYIGKTMEELGCYTSESCESMNQRFERVLKAKRSVTGELSHTSVDGSFGYYDSVYNPVMGLDGNVEFIIGVAHTITERKNAEKALKRMKEELEEKVQQRTNEITIIAERLRTLSHSLLELQEEERRAVARELHDQIGQSLNMVKILLDRATCANSGDLLEILNQARPQLVELIDRVSALSLDLRPKILDDLGLIQALSWYFNRLTLQTNIVVRFKPTGSDKHLSRHIATGLYRVAQETLTNVARHSQATMVIVNLKITRSAISLRIVDNGIGFNQEKIKESLSGGIIGMEERVSLLHGLLRIKSEPGTGTSISATIPC